MTVQRWSMEGQYGAEVYVDEDLHGDFVLFEDYQHEVEALEYELRWYQEQLNILKEEMVDKT